MACINFSIMKPVSVWPMVPPPPPPWVPPPPPPPPPPWVSGRPGSAGNREKLAESVVSNRGQKTLLPQLLHTCGQARTAKSRQDHKNKHLNLEKSQTCELNLVILYLGPVLSSSCELWIVKWACLLHYHTSVHSVVGTFPGKYHQGPVLQYLQTV